MNARDKQLIADYKAQQEQILKQQTSQMENALNVEPENGKVEHAPIQELPAIFADPETSMRVIQAVEKSRHTNTEEPTKFTVLRDLSDKDKLNFHTEFRDFNEIQQMNRGRVWIDLCRLVYTTNRVFMVKQKDGTTKPVTITNSPKIEKILSIYTRHFDNHMENMVSYQRKRELSLVHAVKNDDSVIKTDTAVKQMMGRK